MLPQDQEGESMVQCEKEARKLEKETGDLGDSSKHDVAHSNKNLSMHPHKQE